MTGTVISDSVKGFVFIEAEITHESVFCHISQVKGNRCLHTNDRVRFDLISNPVKPGTTMAGNVEYLGHLVARQVGAKAVQS